MRKEVYEWLIRVVRVVEGVVTVRTPMPPVPKLLFKYFFNFFLYPCIFLYIKQQCEMSQHIGTHMVQPTQHAMRLGGLLGLLGCIAV